MSTYEAYKDFSSNPQLVHDIHLKPSDHIDPQKLNQKLIECCTQPLEIIYAGRIHPDKAPLEWIETLRLVHNAGVDFRARWFGTGPLELKAKSLVETASLARNVNFSGNIDNRAELFNQLRSSHIMVFCHVTPESPRCLIEALASGTPIIGYESAYAQDLISKNGGGVLSAMNPEALAGIIIEIARDPSALRCMIEAAASAGAQFTDVDVFAHRSALMKKYS
jgi:glycosyltransferase involved in cell wall biosynthesis